MINLACNLLSPPEGLSEIDEGVVVVFDTAGVNVGAVAAYRPHWGEPRREIWCPSATVLTIPPTESFKIKWETYDTKNKSQADLETELKRLTGASNYKRVRVCTDRVIDGPTKDGRTFDIELDGNTVGLLDFRRVGSHWVETAVLPPPHLDYPFGDELTFKKKVGAPAMSG